MINGCRIISCSYDKVHNCLRVLLVLMTLRMAWLIVHLFSTLFYVISPLRKPVPRSPGAKHQRHFPSHFELTVTCRLTVDTNLNSLQSIAVVLGDTYWVWSSRRG